MKKTFLENLKKALRPLPKAEREEILAFYQERFVTGADEGLTEAEIIDQLETPEAIAANVLEEYGLTAKKTVDAPMSGVGLILMNLFFTWWFLFMMGTISFSMIGAGAVSFGSVLLSFSSVSSLAGTLYTLAQLGVTMTIIFLGFLAFEGLMRFVAWLVNQHFVVFGNTQPESLKNLWHNLTPSTWFERFPLTRRVSQLVLGVGLLFILVGTGGALVLASDFTPDTFIEIDESYEIPEGPMSIRASLDDGRFIVERYDGDTIQIVGQVRDNQTFKHQLDQSFPNDPQDPSRLIISLESPRFATNINLPFFGATSRPQLTVFIPKGVALEDVMVRSKNGLVLLEGIEALNVDVETSNGSITLVDTFVEESILLSSSNATLTLNRVEAGQKIDMTTSNGRINVRDVFAQEHRYETSNGRVEVMNVNAPDNGGTTMTVRSSNGNLTLNNVYVYTVHLRTTNGSIEYDNADRSFFLDFVEAITTNGTTNVNVPRR